MSTLDEVAQERLRAWAGSVKRLIESAPIRAVVEEVGLAESGHSTPPERRAIRDQAQATVDRWLERDLAIIAGGRHGTQTASDEVRRNQASSGPVDAR